MNTYKHLPSIAFLLKRILKWLTAFILLLVTGVLGSQVWRAIAEAQEPGYDAAGFEIFGVVYAMAIIIPVSSLLALFGNMKAIKSSPLRIWTLSSQVFMGVGYLVYSFITFAIPKNPEPISISEHAVHNQVTANGYWEYYHENGGIESKGHYKDGKPEGLWEFYYETGDIKQRGTYKNGRKDGTEELYYDYYGEIRKIENSIEKDTDILGEWIGRYPGDGFQTINISMVEHQYIATKITGDEYVPAGEITFLLDKNFENCRMQFAEIGFQNPDFFSCDLLSLNSDSIALDVGMPLDFKRNWDGPYDSLKHEKGFKNDERHGLWSTYFKNGRLAIVSNWDNGVDLNQTTKFSYHENGQLKSRAEFKGDDFNGLREDFHENGQLKQTGSYQDGKPIGIWKQFDEEGNITRSEEF